MNENFYMNNLNSKSEEDFDIKSHESKYSKKEKVKVPSNCYRNYTINEVISYIN